MQDQRVGLLVLELLRVSHDDMCLQIALTMSLHVAERTEEARLLVAVVGLVVVQRRLVRVGFPTVTDELAPWTSHR